MDSDVAVLAGISVAWQKCVIIKESYVYYVDVWLFERAE